MKLINQIQKRYKERNNIFLIFDITFSLLTFYFALRILFIVIPALIYTNQSANSIPLLLASMTLSLGLSYAVRVVEMLVTGKKKYFAITLGTGIIALGIAILEFYWLMDK